MSTMQLTTSQFTDAFARHIDESKPDPLAKSQLESICVNWEQEQLDGVNDDSRDSATKTSLCGTLTLSSEYISVSIHALCHWKKTKQSGENDERSCDAISECDGVAKQFQEELFIKLTASATESTAGSKDANKQDRKDRKASKKLRTEMLKRLRSDHYIKQVFLDDKANDDCAPLCEALIQQNLRSGDRSGGGNVDIDELEERVNVEEGTLQGIKNAIFSKSEDNLDVLELLLNMPYLPRSSAASSNNDKGEAVSTEWPSKLADRAYLRLLEDAMFDACEKEGEDELLDDLNISEANHYQRKAAKPGREEKSRNESSKRMRNNR